MKTAKRRVSDMTVDELKGVIHDIIADDLESWREAFEIIGDKKMMARLKQADSDWASGAKGAYVPWDDLKRV